MSPTGNPHVPSPVAAFTARGALLKALGKLCELGLPFRNPEVNPKWDERREDRRQPSEGKGPGSDNGRTGEGRKERAEELKLTLDQRRGVVMENTGVRS